MLSVSVMQIDEINTLAVSFLILVDCNLMESLSVCVCVCACACMCVCVCVLQSALGSLCMQYPTYSGSFEAASYSPRPGCGSETVT